MGPGEQLYNICLPLRRKDFCFFVACGILNPPTRDQTCAPTVVEVQSPNHWPAREVPRKNNLKKFLKSFYDTIERLMKAHIVYFLSNLSDQDGPVWNLFSDS